jgi:arsenate reductase
MSKKPGAVHDFPSSQKRFSPSSPLECYIGRAQRLGVAAASSRPGRECTGRNRDMSELIIYQKPTCSTCREAIKILQNSGQDYLSVNYYERPFTKPQLKALLKKAGLQAKDVLRTKEDIYKKLKLSSKNLSDDALLDLMIKHPDLIQRPIVEKGDTAILARPADTVKQLL